jgi:hypothetical protein
MFVRVYICEEPEPPVYRLLMISSRITDVALVGVWLCTRLYVNAYVRLQSTRSSDLPPVDDLVPDIQWHVGWYACARVCMFVHRFRRAPDYCRQLGLCLSLIDACKLLRMFVCMCVRL